MRVGDLNPLQARCNVAVFGNQRPALLIQLALSVARNPALIDQGDRSTVGRVAHPFGDQGSRERLVWDRRNDDAFQHLAHAAILRGNDTPRGSGRRLRSGRLLRGKHRPARSRPLLRAGCRNRTQQSDQPELASEHSNPPGFARMLC